MTQATSLIITRVRDQGRDIRSFDLLPENALSARDIIFTPGQVAILRAERGEPSYFAFAIAMRLKIGKMLEWSYARLFPVLMVTTGLGQLVTSNLCWIMCCPI